MTDSTVAAYTHEDDLAPVFLGRKIVAAEVLDKRPDGVGFGFNATTGPSKWSDDATDPVGMLTLDDGTRVYVAGNEGGCACSSGCYYLETLATTDNIITKVEVEDASDDEGGGDRDGAYRIFVYVDNVPINVAEFTGTDGNGYYGTGFHLTVIPA